MWLDRIWHGSLRQPYRLRKRLDRGTGVTVVLLHGIGRSGQVWQPLVNAMASEPFRLLAFDLLGFGESPKPQWAPYAIDDHARAVVASIRHERLKGPVVLVGHSMGALVALRVAHLHPELVRHLVLYEMPLYEGLPEKRRYQTRLKLYFSFYEWAIRQQPTFNEGKRRFHERLATKIVGSELTAETWQPFIKSLQNTIMHQTAPDDIKHLKTAADVIYGSRDMLVIRGKVREVFGTDNEITGHTIRVRHTISKKAASFLAERIRTAVEGGIKD